VAKTVLVVDDDADFRDMLAAVLTPDGYKVVPCAHPPEAYDWARQLSPDVIVVDLLMPDQSGWQIIEQVKADPLIAGTPIIVCTAAVAEAMDHVAALRQWGCEVLLKPFDLNDLLSLLAKATARSKSS